MNLFNPKKYAKLQLWGLDSNAFSLMGAFRQQARKEKWPEEDISKVLTEARSSNYDHLVATLDSHCK